MGWQYWLLEEKNIFHGNKLCTGRSQYISYCIELPSTELAHKNAVLTDVTSDCLLNDGIIHIIFHGNTIMQKLKM